MSKGSSIVTSDKGCKKAGLTRRKKAREEMTRRPDDAARRITDTLCHLHSDTNTQESERIKGLYCTGRRGGAKTRQQEEEENIKLSLTCLLSTIIGVMNGSKSMRVIKVVECSSTTTTTSTTSTSALSRTTGVRS